MQFQSYVAIKPQNQKIHKSFICGSTDSVEINWEFHFIRYNHSAIAYLFNIPGKKWNVKYKFIRKEWFDKKK